MRNAISRRWRTTASAEPLPADHSAPSSQKAALRAAFKSRLYLVWAVGLSLVAGASSQVASAEPQALTFSGETRARFESLTGQYRAGRSGSDQVLALRTLLRADWTKNNIGFTGELEDTRTYFDDAGTPLSSSLINPLEILQAKLWMKGSLNDGTDWRAEVGRMTLDIGSRRQVERNGFTNSINNYTGVHLRLDRAGGTTLDAFYVLPISKDPNQFGELDANRPGWDDEQSNRRFWGLHGHIPLPLAGAHLEPYLYGLRETDSLSQPTVDRKLFSPGIRFRIKPAAGRWDADIEAAMRLGSRSVDSAPGAAEQSVRAAMLHAAVGYTFRKSWKPRLAIEFDYASGNDPSSGTYTRYEALFGARRGDLGNSSLHGPLRRSNLIAPGVRLSFSQGNTDGRFLAKLAYLADKSDSWRSAGLQDPDGGSGRKIGNTFDFRVRHHMADRKVIAELGGSTLRIGEFGRRVDDGPEDRLEIYSYVQLTARL